MMYRSVGCLVLCAVFVAANTNLATAQHDDLNEISDGAIEAHRRVIMDAPGEVTGDRLEIRPGAKVFDRVAGRWLEMPEGAVISDIKERCTGWMNSLASIQIASREYYVREWDLSFDPGKDVPDAGLLIRCRTPQLTRQQVVSGQQVGLVQVLTNKVVTPHGETGAVILAGPRFPLTEAFVVDRAASRTTGILKIPANRQVVLETDACRPFIGVKVRYAGGVFWVRALDLDIRMAGENLAKSPLGSAAWILCDEVANP